jgi:hypothetical protein
MGTAWWPTNGHIHFTFGWLLRESASSSATQKLPNILHKPKVHYHAHTSPPLATVPSQMHSISITPSYSYKIHFNTIFPHPPLKRLDLPSSLYPSDYSTKNPMCSLLWPYVRYIFYSSDHWISLKGFWRWYMVYKTRMLMDYIHRPVSSIDRDISETGSVSETSWSIERKPVDGYKSISILVLYIWPSVYCITLKADSIHLNLRHLNQYDI